MPRTSQSTELDLLRKPFTVQDVQEKLDLSLSSARGRVNGWLEEGLIVPTGEVLQWVDEEGEPLPGRPRIIYRRSR